MESYRSQWPVVQAHKTCPVTTKVQQKLAFFSGPFYRYFSQYAVVELQKQFAFGEVTQMKTNLQASLYFLCQFHDPCVQPKQLSDAFRSVQAEVFAFGVMSSRGNSSSHCLCKRSEMKREGLRVMQLFTAEYYLTI